MRECSSKITFEKNNGMKMCIVTFSLLDKDLASPKPDGSISIYVSSSICSEPFDHTFPLRHVSSICLSFSNSLDGIWPFRWELQMEAIKPQLSEEILYGQLVLPLFTVMSLSDTVGKSSNALEMLPSVGPPVRDWLSSLVGLTAGGGELRSECLTEIVWTANSHRSKWVWSEEKSKLYSRVVRKLQSEGTGSSTTLPNATHGEINQDQSKSPNVTKLLTQKKRRKRARGLHIGTTGFTNSYYVTCIFLIYIFRISSELEDTTDEHC